MPLPTALTPAAATRTPAPQQTPRELPEMSIYHVGAEWQDQAGKSLKLEELRGRVRVMCMVYTTCKGACPQLIHEMQVMEKKLGPAEREQVEFLLVSIDPEVDTPEQLRSFVSEKKLGPRWRIITGKPDDVRELAATLNFRYRKTSEKDYAHSNMISVLNREGEVIHQQVGLAQDPGPTLACLHQLLSPP